MARLLIQPWCLATALLVPLLTLGTPPLLRLAGVPPCWPVLWLLPWALADGPLSGALAGLAVGLLVDGLHPGWVSQIPALVGLGWWWGRIGRRGPPIRRSFNLALLALLGSALLGCSLMVQWALSSWRGALVAGGRPAGSAAGLDLGVEPALLALPGWHGADLLAAGVHSLLAQTLLTALLAPILCSLQLLLWRQLLAGFRG
ncbi:MAG: rod shape-determining protein MreD [Synechococcaceae cyanobacterium]|jgi:hypothetical protein